MDLQLSISHIMTRDIVVVSPKTTLTEVAEIFNSHDFHHLPVIDEDYTPVGIISKSDFLQIQDRFTRLGYEDAEEKNERFFRSVLAQDIMTKKPVWIRPDASIQTALSIFLENLFHALIIADEGRCIGIVTTHDILAYVNKTAPALI